jgi:heptosyltransferase-2
MTPESSPSRLIIRMPNWLGDCVMSAPVICAIKKSRPGVSVNLMIKNGIAGVARLIPGVDDVITLDGNSGAAISSVRQARYDAALILPNSFRSAWEMWRAGVPVRVGYASGFRSPLLTHRVKRPQPHSMSMTDYYLRVAQALYPEITVGGAGVAVPSSAVQNSFTLLPKTDRPLVGLGFGASYGSAKMWPKERYAELTGRLAETADVVLLGAESDRETEREIMARAGGKAVSLVGKTDLTTLAAVMSRLSLYISNDTGPMHISAGLGVPTIAIFGPTSPEETRPLGANVTVIRHKADCAPCFKRECPTDHRCMTAVTVDEIVETARRVAPISPSAP